MKKLSLRNNYKLALFSACASLSLSSLAFSQSDSTPSNQSVEEIQLPEVEVLNTVCPSNPEGIKTMAVAVSVDGKYLTPESSFRQSSLATPFPNTSPTTFQGWLAHDATWRILKLQKDRDVLPTRFVPPSSLELTPGKRLFLPYLNYQNELSVEVLKILDPSVAALAISKNPKIVPGSFWISATKVPLMVGTPVFDDQLHLITQLTIRCDPDGNPLQLLPIQCPASLLDQSAQQVDPVPLYSQPSSCESIFAPSDLPPAIVTSLLNDPPTPSLFKQTNQLLQNYSQTPSAWFLAIQTYHRLNRPELALASAEMLTQVTPTLWMSWYTYGQELELERKFNTALDAYQKASDLALSQGPSSLGNPLDPLESRPNKSLPLNENQTQLRQGQRLAGQALARILWEEGHQTESIERLKKHLEFNPQDYEGWISLTQHYLDQGLNEQALSAAHKILQMNPVNTLALQIQTSAQIKAGQMADAEPSIELLKEINPQSAQDLPSTPR